jgi:hypothetical protein
MGKPQHKDDEWVKRVVSMSYRYGWVVIEGERVAGYSVGITESGRARCIKEGSLTSL